MTAILPCWFNWWYWIVAIQADISTYAELETYVSNMSVNDYYKVTTNYYQEKEQYPPYLIQWLVPWSSSYRLDESSYGPYMQSDHLAYTMDKEDYDYTMSKMTGWLSYMSPGSSAYSSNYSYPTDNYSPIYNYCWWKKNWPFVIAYDQKSATFTDMMNTLISMKQVDMQSILNGYMSAVDLPLSI